MFEDNTYHKLFYKVGLKDNSVKSDFTKVLIAFAVLWIPLAVITLFNNSFWTGNITTSFITDFDVQARLFLSLPILILADRTVTLKLSLILKQFINSGIVGKELHKTFEDIVQRRMLFLRSGWTDLVVLALCYLQLYLVFHYESTSTSILSWQVVSMGFEPSLNLAGIWATFISGPFVLFLFYRWLLRIIVWGLILYKISRLNLTLFPVHPDLMGGLGFIGYAIRYFSPIALAMSATVAGNMADFMLDEGLHLVDLRFFFIVYFFFITLLFTLPLISFSMQLIDAREESIFKNYDYTNGIYRELRKKISKGYDQVKPEDLKLPDFSAAADLSAVVDNALKMKTIPFTFKDIVPLWIMAAIPFIGVVLIEIPFNQILKQAITLLAS